VTTISQFEFGDDRARAIRSIESIDSGRGWCNVVPCVVEDIPDIKINFTGIWVKRGVDEASFVTSPARNGVEQPSSLGVLQLRGRLGRERIATLLGGARTSSARITVSAVYSSTFLLVRLHRKFLT